MAFWTGHSSRGESGQSSQPPGVEALVVQAQGGDQQAFETLYTYYNGQINRYLGRMVGHDGIGCELTQEVFFKAWTALPSLHSPARFLPWLYRIALNCARYHQKRTGHIQVVPLDESVEGNDELSVAGPEEGVEKTELLQAALSQVSPVYRSCLILYVIEELPQREIAQRLNIKESCVSQYVSRGKEELRQIYYQLQRGQNGKNGRTRHGRRGQ